MYTTRSISEDMLECRVRVQETLQFESNPFDERVQKIAQRLGSMLEVDFMEYNETSFETTLALARLLLHTQTSLEVVLVRQMRGTPPLLVQMLETMP